MYKITKVTDRNGNEKKSAIKQIKEICPEMTGTILYKDMIFIGSRFCFLWSGDSGQMMRTSPIVEITEDDNKIHVVTMNTEYWLEDISAIEKRKGGINKMYKMRICKCGRIHMIPMEKIDNALDKDKNLLLLCGGCGKGTVIGADIQPDYIEPQKDGYSMYFYDFSTYWNKEISILDFESTENQKGFEEIFYSHGIKVPMMTGQYATDYFYEKFSDRWYPDFYKIQKKNISVSEIMEFIDKYNQDRTTVNMDRFLGETPEEMLEVISRYPIKGFNWEGTKWERL